MDEYISLRHDHRKLENQKNSLENQLEQFFNQQHCDQIELKMGILRRVKEGDRVQWVIEI